MKPTALYNALRTTARLVRCAIQRFIPRREPVRLKHPAKRFNQLQMKR